MITITLQIFKVWVEKILGRHAVLIIQNTIVLFEKWMFAMKNENRVLVTGGLGFIGCNLVDALLHCGYTVLNVDKLSYASNLPSMLPFSSHPNYFFECLDIADIKLISAALESFDPNFVFHCAAESHVDNSICDPTPFIESNILGTYNLLEALRKSNLTNFVRMIHVSTDEVYGHLGKTGQFNETSPYRPNSPYSASKASSDLLARAWRKTFGIPLITTNCSNNYGPYQHQEKMIPKTIKSILSNEEVCVYGDGSNVRNWLYVSDHVECLLRLMQYNGSKKQFLIGSDIELTNEELVHKIHRTIQKFDKTKKLKVKYVEDRVAHDFRYSIDFSVTSSEVGWHPRIDLEKALTITIKHYFNGEGT